MHDHCPSHDHGRPHDHSFALGRLLELDAEVHADMQASATTRVAEVADVAFGNLFAALRPGGLPSVLEMDAAPRALAGDGAGSVRELGELWIRGTRTPWTALRP